MRNDPNRIDEEEVCFDSLVHRLREVASDLAISHQRVAPGDDPPDYWLSVGDRRFAVEITSIAPGQSYHASCASLYEEVRDECRSGGTLAGVYSMSFMRRPNLPTKNRSDKLVAACCARIGDMSGDPTGAQAVLLRDSGGNLTISKVSDRGSDVLFATFSEFKYDVDVQAELAQLVAAAIEQKHGKLKKKGVLDVCPDIILALFDAYGYAYVPTVRQTFARIQGFEWLHSIYWAASFADKQNILYPESPGQGGVFLYSKTADWR